MILGASQGVPGRRRSRAPLLSRFLNVKSCDAPATGDCANMPPRDFPAARHTRVLALLAGVGTATLALGASAGSLDRLQYSADIGARWSPSTASALDHDYVTDEAGTLNTVQIPGIPAGTDLDALQIEANYDRLFSLDTSTLIGGTRFRDADVIRLHAGVYTRAFDASAAGVPAGVDCDAVARAADGRLLLSFDRSFRTGGQLIRPVDVVSHNGSSFTMVLDGRAAGLPAGSNLDALDSTGSNTALMFSLDVGGRVGGVRFADEDVLQVVIATSTITRELETRTRSVAWNAADLDALAVAVVADGLFRDGFE